MKSLLRPVKRFVNAMRGKDFLWNVKPEFQCEKKRFGSSYGGWDVATDDISSNSVVYSFGLGEDISFDLELINQYGVTIHAFDPTPKSIEWVSSQNPPNNFILHEYGLADFDGNVTFNAPVNPEHVSHSILDINSTSGSITVAVKKIKTIMSEIDTEKIDVLKMDIEGAEYQVIDNIISSNVRPNQLLIEFHHRFPNVGIKKTNDAISKLKNSGYQIFSVSPSHEEFCFILVHEK